MVHRLKMVCRRMITCYGILLAHGSRPHLNPLSGNCPTNPGTGRSAQVDTRRQGLPGGADLALRTDLDINQTPPSIH